MAKAFVPLLIATAAAACISCVSSCASSAGDENESIFPDSIELRAGDLAFRCGGSLDSRAVMIADHGGNFSHVGIVVDNNGTRMIVHAVPDEPEFEGDVDRVKMETPQKFFIRKNAIYGQISRHPDSVVARKAGEIALGVYNRNTLFDSEFNLADTTKMYCTELILYSFDRAGDPLHIKPRHKAQWMDHQSVMPSDIIETDKFQKIYSF